MSLYAIRSAGRVAGLLATILASPLVAQSTGQIQGTVTDGAGAPVANAEVRIVSIARLVRTDASGSFVFEAVPPGAYVLDADQPRYGRVTERVRVEAGAAVQVTLRLDPVFHGEEILVTAGPEAVRRSELYQAADVLGGRELRSRIEPSLGETLRHQPGVNATYFGPGSSRPIIRGLGGDRVRVLEGGVGTGDASSTSPDHAVSLEPQSAERIEVVRGPATLLYGSSAIGGVVNVIDNRVPDEMPTQPVRGEVRGLLGSVSDERTGAFELNGGFGRIAWHLGGLLRETGDYSIPGFADADHEGGAAPGEERGVLENSAIETQRGAIGLSWIGDNGYLGASVSGLFSKYGVPGEAHGDEANGAEEEAVAIDLEQRRFDAEGTWRFSGRFLRGIKARLGVSDYEHVELEGDETGTIFRNDARELRVEAQHRIGGSIHGAFGAQLMSRDFEAIGEEAFVPPNDTRGVALFVFEEMDRGPARYQIGARWERQTSEDQSASVDRSFNGFSFSAGVNYGVSDAVTVSAHGARSVKLPSAEELFSNGPHLATRSFEVGDIDLDTEVGTSLDLTLRVAHGRVEGEVTGFVNRFDRFIYPSFTGAEIEGLPVLQYTQGDASFVGFEGRADIELYHAGTSHLAWELMADAVRGTLSDDDQPLPRIPPFRFGTGLRMDGTAWGVRANAMRTAAQNRVADFETATDGYTTLDVTANYRFFAGGTVHELILSGRNLGNSEARSHVSLLKDIAPMPGREIRLAYRLSF